MTHITPSSCGPAQTSTAWVRRSGLAAGLVWAAAIGTSAPAVAQTSQSVEVVGRSEAAGLAASAGGTRLNLSAFDTAASVEAATQAQLQDRGVATLADSARGFTGITSALRAGAPGVFSSRGFVENGLGVLFDGVRIGGATLTMRNLDAYTFERIELLRGPASVLHGEGSGAGAINFVRRAPQTGPLRGDALVQAGSDRQLRLGAALAGSVADNTAVSLAAVRHRFDGPADAQSTTLQQLVLGTRVKAAPNWALFAEVDDARSRVDNAYWGTPLVGGHPASALARKNYNQARDNRYDDDVRWLRVGAEGQLGVVDYKGQVFSYRAERDWKNLYAFSSTNVPGRIQPRAVENLAYDHRMHGTRHEAGFSAMAGALRTVAGLEWQSTTFNSPRSTSGTRPDFDINQPQPVSFDSFGLPRADARRASVNQTALFAESRLVLGAGFSLTGALRYNDLVATISRPNAGVRFDKTFAYTDGRVGAMWQPNASHALYASAASGKEPVESLFIYDPSQQSFELTRYQALEVGSKHRLPDGLGELTVALYDLARRDIPANDPNTANAFVQIGKQSSRGVELSMLLKPLPALTLEGNAAILKARFDTAVNFVGGVGAVPAGTTPPNVPKQVFNLAVRWQALPALALGVQAQHVATRKANIAGTVDLPAYTTADLWARLALGSSPAAGALTLRVKNVGDELTAVWASSGFGQTNVVYGDARRVELAWQGRF